MITIEKEKVILSRETRDRLVKDDYFEELIQNLIDTDTIAEAMENDNDFIDIREYDRQRRL